MAEEEAVRGRIEKENLVYEKVDDEGIKWKKVYFGGGAHFRNWLNQAEELWGKENVEVEEADSTGFHCYEEGGEKMYRIWVREDSEAELYLD